MVDLRPVDRNRRTRPRDPAGDPCHRISHLLGDNVDIRILNPEGADAEIGHQSFFPTACSFVTFAFAACFLIVFTSFGVRQRKSRLPFGVRPS